VSLCEQSRTGAERAEKSRKQSSDQESKKTSRVERAAGGHGVVSRDYRNGL